jgi:hypothetical protein
MIANPATGSKDLVCADHNPQWFPLRRSGNTTISMGTRIGRKRPASTRRNHLYRR